LTSDANVARQAASEEGFPDYTDKDDGAFVYVARSRRTDSPHYARKGFARDDSVWLGDIYGRRRVDESGRFIGGFERNPHFVADTVVTTRSSWCSTCSKAWEDPTATMEMEKYVQLSGRLIEPPEMRVSPKVLAQKRALIAEMLHPGGSGDAHDAELVAKELEKLPLHVLQRLDVTGTRVVAARGNVTDYFHSLSSERPRGYSEGRTYKDCMGLYDPSTNTAVIAVQGHGTATGPHLPRDGQTVLHEALHAADRIPGQGGQLVSVSSAPFNAARDADLGTLPDYYRQDGE
jgi:hypothetical protein